MTTRRTATRVLLAVLLPACAARATVPPSRPQGAAAMAPPSASTALIELLAAANGPKATLTFDTTVVAGTRGSLCWSGSSGGFCADMDPRALVPSTYVEVPLGTVLMIRGDASTVSGVLGRVRRKGTVPMLVALQRLAFPDGTEIVTLGPGRYALQLVGSWPQGEAPFYFGLRVRH